MQDMIVGAKYKAEKVEEFDARGHTHTSESNYAGIDDVYSLTWRDMLMAVSGVSEKKPERYFSIIHPIAYETDGCV